MSHPMIGARLKALRETKGLSQDDVAAVFGFKDRQTVSAIETGERRLSADELILAMEKLGASLDYFTDPFQLIGEGQFNWRQTGVGAQRLAAYERLAGRWIAAFRTLAPKVGRRGPLLRRALGLSKRSTFEEAAAAGERFAAEFALGETPAAALARVMEGELGLLVLNVDAFEGISGAACRLTELDAVLINRAEIEGRRRFDLAHELFHALTWEAMPPEHSEAPSETGGNRVEQLANSFASAVLMPEAILARFGPWGDLAADSLVDRLNDAADELEVTATALRWRLAALGAIGRSDARAIPEAALRFNGRRKPEAAAPAPLFSRPFMEVIGAALDQGLVSVRRTAGLLDLTIEDLAELFPAHGLEAPFEP